MHFFSQLYGTKAAYSQGKIGPSNKTGNFVNRLGEGKAYNNRANAQHSLGDFITAIDYLKHEKPENCGRAG